MFRFFRHPLISLLFFLPAIASAGVEIGGTRLISDPVLGE